MIITISGKSCSGKTTIAKKIAKELNYDFFSVGNYFRQHYKNKQTNVNDYFLDKIQQNLINNNKNIVLEGRMSGIFLKKYSKTPENLSVFLNVNTETQIKRYLHRENNKSIKEAIEKTYKRDLKDEQRLNKIYNTSIFYEKNYDLIINTNNKKIDHIIKSILTEAKKNEQY